jgi:multidrug resistance efflux pump
MKSFNFKTKTSVIKTLKEPPKAKQKINWQKWSWIGILSTIVLFCGFRVFNGVAILRGNGQVELKKQALTFTNDIKILDILVEEGQEVKKGDTLFFYHNEYNEIGNSIRNSYNAQKPIDWIEKERLNLRKQIALKNIEKDNLSSRLKFKNDEFKHQQDLVLLGVNNIEYTLTSIESEIMKIEVQEKILKEEISFLRKHLYRLRKQEAEIQKLETDKQTFEKVMINEIIPYVALIDGIIGNINFSPNEVCYEKQDVMTIHQKENISIRAYFDPELMSHLEINDVMQIKFPDGMKGLGRISNIYISTKELPVEFQSKYEPVRRNVVIDIMPITEEEGTRWVNFYKMTVDVSKLKYEL